MSGAAADERRLSEARERESSGLTRREALVRGSLAACFVAAAAALAALAPTERHAQWWAYAAFAAAFAAASRIRFEVASGVASPLVVVLVPALFLLPARDVPLVVLAALAAAAAVEAALGRLPVTRAAVVGVWNSWFSIGPALVFAAAGEPSANARDAIAVVALGLLAQFAFDGGSAVVGERLALGIPPRELVRPLRDAFAIDALLAPLGYFAALAQLEQAWAVILPAPLLALLVLFAHERRERLDRVLHLLDEVRASEVQFRELTAAIPEVFLLFGVEPREVLYVSPAFEAVWGRPGADAAGWLDGVHPEDRARAAAELAGGAERVVESSFRVVRPDGEIRWVVAQLFPIFDADGSPIRIAGIARDLSEQRRLEEQLRQSQKMEAVGQLAGGVAHDFNNLLTVIRGHVELALPHVRDAEVDRALHEISDAANRATELTRQILAFSRRQLMAPKVINLNTVVSDTQALVERLIGENVLVELRLAPDVGNVLADAGQVGQVVMNLAINARDAMPDGGILTIATENVRLEAEAAEERELVPGLYARLAVSDTGVGMDDETQRRIFEPFFTTKEPGKGTGLGLSTCYGIVKQLGGHIEAVSEPGRGATFQLWFPLTAEAAAAVAATCAGPAPARAERTVLLVEDDETVRTVVLQMLERDGHAVRAVSTPAAALRAWEVEGPFDVLVTDLSMPGLTGRELAARLGDAAVVYISGYSSEPVDGSFLQKPFTAAELGDAVRAALDAQKPPLGGAVIAAGGRR